MTDSEGLERRKCPECGEMIVVDAKLCRFCKTRFDGTTQPTPETPDSTREPEGDATGGVIPYKTTCALIAYYCGVFSIIPCFIIGVAAFVLGIKGLKYAKAHPEVKGQVHAWIGIVAGGFFGLGYLILNLFLLVAWAVANK